MAIITSNGNMIILSPKIIISTPERSLPHKPLTAGGYLKNNAPYKEKGPLNWTLHLLSVRFPSSDIALPALRADAKLAGAVRIKFPMHYYFYSYRRNTLAC
jgi:hypothetical protein